GCGSNGVLDQSRYSQPLPWIGLYIAGASAVCALFMSLDAFHGIRYKKPWFPCKFFALNSMTLTLIGVAVKLSVDLNTSMPRPQDQLVKLSSGAFLCTAIANSMPSLGLMETKDLVMNVVALSILIITVIVNICIQLATGVIYELWFENIALLLLMAILLAKSISSSLAIPAAKWYLDRKYSKKFRKTIEENERNLRGDSSLCRKLKEDLMKHWMMAHTCNPQFVVGRLATCTSSGAFCLLSAAVLTEAVLRIYLMPRQFQFCGGESDYRWSIMVILVAQAVAVAVGTIAPASRWFLAIKFRCPNRKSSPPKIWITRVEHFWIHELQKLKEYPLEMRFGGRKFRKAVHKMKYEALNLCIAFQKGMVVLSKAVRLTSILLMRQWRTMRNAFDHLVNLIKFRNSNAQRLESSGGSSGKLDLSNYVLYLEGEEELIDLMRECERDSTGHWIKMGRKKHPKNLTNLLKNMAPSTDFKGVKNFDSKRVPSLNSREPPNSWALPVVTLTSIAVAAANHTDPASVKCLIKSVNEALEYVRVVENTIDIKKKLTNVRKAAEVLWLGVDYHHKWLDVDLYKMAVRGTSPKDTILELCSIAKSKFAEMRDKDVHGYLGDNPSKWPYPALAANSMYRTCQTLLLNGEYESGKEILDRLTTLIVDIIGACLTNIQEVISLKTHQTYIEYREESVRGAFLLLGETENIMEILSCHCVPVSGQEKLACINEWRALSIGEDEMS
ncbi:hypothetical protein M569_13390, partial [Genlisea aurea]